MIARLALFAASLAGGVGGGGVFTACEGGPVPAGCCEPGDRLDVLYAPGQDGRALCDRDGGVFRPAPALHPTLDGCEGVDF
jgi:hypothetical protein